MGKPLMIQAEDDRRIENLKAKLGARAKVDVVRAGLTLLELEAERRDRIERWKRSAKSVSSQSKAINQEFQKSSRIKRT